MNAFEKFSMVSEAVDQQLNEAVVREVAEGLGVTVEEFDSVVAALQIRHEAKLSTDLAGGFQKGVGDWTRSRLARQVRDLKKAKPKAYGAVRRALHAAKDKVTGRKVASRVADTLQKHQTTTMRLRRAAKKAAANK